MAEVPHGLRSSCSGFRLQSFHDVDFYYLYSFISISTNQCATIGSFQFYPIYHKSIKIRHGRWHCRVSWRDTGDKEHPP